MHAPVDSFSLPLIKPQINHFRDSTSRSILLGAWWRNQQCDLPNLSICEEHRAVMRMPRVQGQKKIRAGESINGAISMRMRINLYCLRHSPAAARLTIWGDGVCWVLGAT